MSKGTILYVGNFELPDKGASANRVMTNRLLFRECGYRTVYLGVTREEQFMGVRQSSFDMDVFERAYPNSTKIWLERLYSLKDLIEITQKYDDIRAVIFYNAPYCLVRKAHGYFRRNGVKVLYDCTEWSADTEGNLPKRLFKKYDAVQIQRRLNQVVDGLIVISSLMEKAYHRVPKLLLPPLIDIEASMWKQERGRRDDTFEYCYAGDPGKKDDLCILIDAFLQLDFVKSRLQIIGVEKKAFLLEHPEYALELQKKETQIVFTGKIPHEMVIQKLINTDCFIFIRESNLRNNAGFPTKFVEAYTSGTRIIATNISDIASYQRNSILLLECISQDEVMNSMREIRTRACTASLQSSFDYHGYVARTKQFLEDVLAEKKGRSR